MTERAKRDTRIEPSLNGGTKLHPLSASALGALDELIRVGPLPYGHFNPGVIDRLSRETLIEVVNLPSPFASHKPGTLIRHVKITGAGRARRVSNEGL